MYVPVGWPRYLSIGKGGGRSSLKCVVCNRYRMLFAIITETTISIWHCRPCVEIVCYQRCHSSIASLGINILAEWRQDSSMLAVATSNKALLIYQLEQDVKGQKGLNLYDYANTKSIQGDSNDAVPALRLSLKYNVQYTSNIISISCVRDDLLVSLSDSGVELISWNNASTNRKCIPLYDIPFSVDVYQNSELKYSPYMDGFAIVLSDGRAALMIMDANVNGNGLNDHLSTTIEPENWNARCIWASGLTNAVCASVNNKYRLLAFGTLCGKSEVYGWDDVTGSLQLSHQIALSKVNYPDSYNKTGSVSAMQWSPDGCVLALSWGLGGFSLWTVYGACLMCTLGDEHVMTADGTRKSQAFFKSMCWGAEGYQLWTVQKNVKPNLNDSSAKLNGLFSNSISGTNSSYGNQQYINKHLIHEVEGDLADPRDYMSKNTSSVEECSLESDTGQLLQLHFVKSALTMNPCSGNHLHVFLQGEDRLLISYGDRGSALLKRSHSHKQNCFKNDIDRIVGNKQWSVIQMPISYLNGNWPIRYTAIDKYGQLLAIAGNFGLAHYSNISRKWKLFGNIMQEKDMVVTGGLTWWEDFIIVACYNLLENQDEIRIYPRATNLDNVFAFIHKVNSQVLLVNIYHNILIVFDATCCISLFIIGRNTSLQHDSALLQPIKALSVAQYVPYPSLVVSVTMTSLHMESGGRRSSETNFQHETEVIIINVAGRLLLLQRNWEELDHNSDPELGQLNLLTYPSEKSISFNNPVVLASSVENIWTTEQKNRERIHLSDALWLSCGSAGLRVWLPLFPHPTHNMGHQKSQRDFQVLQSRRITLNLEPDTCYPLAVLFQNAIVLGVKSETALFKPIGETKENSELYSFPFSTIERTSQIYLHQILRQLLRRNLGYHALQLALSCRSLAYFPHVLELMLHKVVEEEATASAPIPDPLLPTVVKFLAEFPEYLETIVHCARKTEIALWQYLFNSVGVPRELFEECLEAGQLETAASYLIILQNLEKLSVARQDATRLLDNALQARKWTLAADITRFLKAIGVGDGSTSPRQPTLLNTNIYPAVAPVSVTDAELVGKFNTTSRKPSRTEAPVSRQYSMLSGHPDKVPYRHPAYGKDEPSKHPPIKTSLSMPSPSLNTSESTDSRLEGDKRVVSECAEHYFIEVILTRQAKRLLTDRNLKDLFTFAAHLGFHLVPWLRKERCRVARVNDAVATLKAVHNNFDWPYPVTKTSPRVLYKGSFQSLSQDSISSLDQQMKNVQIHNSTSEDSSFVMVQQQSLLADAQRQFQQDESPFHSTTQPSSGNLLTLLPVKEGGSSWTLNAFSEVSEVSESSLTVDDNNYSTNIAEELIEIVAETKPPKAEMQLTYILELMLEADCLELAMIVSLVMADSSAFHRVVHSSKSSEDHVTPLDTLQRTRDCLRQIESWSLTECLGYVAVLRKMATQVHEFYSIVNTREIQHAEEQAILAMSPKSEKQSHTRSISSESFELDTATNKNISSERKLKSAKSGFHMNLPGKAKPASLSQPLIEYDDTLDGIYNIPNSNDFKIPRSRHNSVPSTSSNPNLSPVATTPDKPNDNFMHTRTASSPAKISNLEDNFKLQPVKNTPNAVELVKGNESDSSTLHNSSCHESDGDNDEDQTPSEDDESGCVVS